MFFIPGEIPANAEHPSLDQQPVLPTEAGEQGTTELRRGDQNSDEADGWKDDDWVAR